MTTGRFALSLRLGLRRLHVLLAVIAVALSLAAVAPHGASAEPNTGGSPTDGAKKTCTDAGGTWTIDGTKGKCTGMGWPKDYSCDLTIDPKGTACSHLPKPRMVATGPIRNVSVGNVGVVRANDPTPVPTYVAVNANVSTSVMSPLDE